MNRFADKFKQLEKDFINEQRRMPTSSCLNVYYGLTKEKYYRLSFVSTTRPFKLESTKEIKVTQGKEIEDVYWTCFDLISEEAKDVFFIFCESLIESIEEVNDEHEALNNIRERYYSWRLLLKNKGKMAYENYQGLFGELYFLSEILGKKYDIESVINAWVGPDGYSKDFSINYTWYEIKTIGMSSTCVKINSLSQLDSEVTGHLVCIQVEKMSDQFDDGMCSVPKLYNKILEKISSHQTREDFINKVLKYGYVDEEFPLNNRKFEVKRITSYLADDKFPKMTKNDIKEGAISNITYDLLISAIEKYKEEN